jgi:hypothetical protein
VKLLLKPTQVHAHLDEVGSRKELEFVIEATHVTVLDKGVSLCLDNFGIYNRRTADHTADEFVIREMQTKGKLEGRYKRIRRVRQPIEQGRR